MPNSHLAPADQSRPCPDFLEHSLVHRAQCELVEQFLGLERLVQHPEQPAPDAGSLERVQLCQQHDAPVGRLKILACSLVDWGCPVDWSSAEETGSAPVSLKVGDHLGRCLLDHLGDGWLGHRLSPQVHRCGDATDETAGHVLGHGPALVLTDAVAAPRGP